MLSRWCVKSIKRTIPRLMRSRKVPPMRELPQVGDKPPGGRADAIFNRRQLLSAAAEFVTQVGAEKVTMDDLASYSGLGKGTVFRHFYSRAGIFRALLRFDRRSQGAATGRVWVLTLLGYHTCGDDGGGDFFCDASSFEPDSGGTTIMPASNLATGRWKRLAEGQSRSNGLARRVTASPTTAARFSMRSMPPRQRGLIHAAPTRYASFFRVGCINGRRRNPRPRRNSNEYHNES
jgi:Bacterial regulatory proteins, tetR family